MGETNPAADMNSEDHKEVVGTRMRLRKKEERRRRRKGLSAAV